MKYFIVIAIISLSLISCNKSSDSGPSADPIYGKWSSVISESGGTTVGFIGELKDDGTVQFIYYKATATSDTSINGYLRINKGTYKKEGDVFDITYTKETCNPVRAEKLTIKTGSDRDTLIVSNSTSVSTYKRLAESTGTTNVTTTLTEDTACNKF